MARKRSVVSKELEEMLKFFSEEMNGMLSNDVFEDYCSHVRQIDRLNEGKTCEWLYETIENASSDSNPVDEIIQRIERILINASKKDNLKSRYLSGFRKFAESIIGIHHANTWLLVDKSDDIVFCKLVAKNILFASKEVVEDVKNGNLGTTENKNKKGNVYASWDYMMHARNNNVKKGQTFQDQVVTEKIIKDRNYNVDIDIIADDNTYANRYLKTAIAESFKRKLNNSLFNTSNWSFFKGYEVCHIWDVPTDRRYYASIANLALVPRALAQMTDHNDEVKKMLRYEVFKRFEFKPDDEEEPKEPKYYKDLKWR